jgi:hypothetical protein
MGSGLMENASPPPAARVPLSVFWERHAFSIGDADFRWLDVVVAAMAHGDWPTFERRLTEGLACAERAAAENIALPEAAIEAAAIAYRYERDLISGSDMSAWLTSVGISTDEWMAYVTRDVLRRTWADELDTLIDRYAPSQRQLEAVVIAEGICSGLFEAFETAFSERTATVFELSPDQLDTAYAASPSHTQAAARLVQQYTHWLAARPDADALARAIRILVIDDAYRAVSERSVSNGSLMNVIDAHRLDWVVTDIDSLTFASEEAAREALLCVREDGLSLQDVGALSRHPVTRARAFLEDAPAECRDQLLSVEPGGLLGPLLVDGQYQVAVVLGRTTPTLQDERIVQRARAVLRAQADRQAARDHVKRRPPV